MFMTEMKATLRAAGKMLSVKTVEDIEEAKD